MGAGAAKWNALLIASAMQFACGLLDHAPLIASACPGADHDAMAQAVKTPEVTKTFETAGSPVAYIDAPEFSKFAPEG